MVHYLHTMIRVTDPGLREIRTEGDRIVIGAGVTMAQIVAHRDLAFLAQVARVSTLGELTASIAHEVNQPLAAIVANGHAAQRWLAASPPDETEAKAAVGRIIRDANLAGNVIHRIRGFVRRREPQQVPLDLDEVIRDVVDLVRSADGLLASALPALPRYAPSGGAAAVRSGR